MNTERKSVRLLVQIGRWLIYLPASALMERIFGYWLFLLTKDLFLSWFGTDYTHGMGYVDMAFAHPVIYGWIACIQSYIFVVTGALIVPKGNKIVAVLQGVLRIGFFMWILLQLPGYTDHHATISILFLWVTTGAILGVIWIIRNQDNEKNIPGDS